MTSFQGKTLFEDFQCLSHVQGQHQSKLVGDLRLISVKFDQNLLKSFRGMLCNKNF